ncbi:unnamed protein product, partial [Polarella glacialis]
MIPKLISGVPVEFDLLGRCALSGTSREITGKLHNEGGTRTEQGSRRTRPGLDSDQAACLHRVTLCCFGVTAALLTKAVRPTPAGGTIVTFGIADEKICNTDCCPW